MVTAVVVSGRSEDCVVLLGEDSSGMSPRILELIFDIS